MAKHKEILVSSDEFETRVAIVEDRQLVEFYIEENDRHRLAGNIYLGRVKDVLPGMEASFVDIGLERNAFLFINEVSLPDIELDSAAHDIQKLVKPGQEILVQVIKEPVGTKGPRVTTQVALPGRWIVLLPLSRFVGVSKRLEGEERARLHDLADKICPPDMGLIVRTAAKNVEESVLQDDLRFLINSWGLLQERLRGLRPPVLVNEELQLYEKIIRDVYSEEYDRLLFEDRGQYERALELVEKIAPQLKRRVKLYQGRIPLYDKFNVESQVESALKRRVWLRSGGYIAIDRTEALTAVDVNTAKYTGGRNLEQTIYRTNLEAASEIARQLRLRDIGGIIVIDFIDMHEPAHKEAVFEELNRALEEDRTKSRVIEISRIGLVEMTRKNLSEGLESHFFERCPRCSTGKVINKRRAAIEAFRKIKRVVLTHPSPAFIFEVASDVMELLEHEDWLSRLTGLSGKEIFLKEASRLFAGEVALWQEGTRAQMKKIIAG